MRLLQHVSVASCLLAISGATPLSFTSTKSKRANLDPVKTFRGLWWDVAQTTCSSEEYDRLVEIVRVTDGMVNDFRWQSKYYDTPAWHRYFVRDSKVQQGWKRTSLEKNTYERIVNSIQLAAYHPKRGKKDKKKHIFTQRKSLTLSCGAPPGLTPRTKCADYPEVNGRWTGPSAMTYTPIAYSDQGYLVVFCPRFFKDGRLRYMNDILKTPKPESEMPFLESYERTMAHEWMHADVFGWKYHIGDEVGWFQGADPGMFPNGRPPNIYGDDRSHRYAWKFMTEPGGKININVADNAENYALMFEYDKYYKTFGWKSDGSYGTSSLKVRDANETSVEARDVPAPASDDNDEAEFTDLGAEDTITEDVAKDGRNDAPPKNCRAVDDDDGVECAYVDDEYDTFDPNQPLDSEGECELSAKCRFSFGNGYAVDPSCTCTCDGQRTPLSDSRCAGFAGSLPNPSSGGSSGGSASGTLDIIAGLTGLGPAIVSGLTPQPTIAKEGGLGGGAPRIS